MSELEERRKRERRASSPPPWWAPLTGPRWIALVSAVIACTLYLSISSLLGSAALRERLDAIERPTPERQRRALERAIGELSPKQAGAIMRRALDDPATRRELRDAF